MQTTFFQIAEKNDQIDKLIKRVTTLHTLNNEFASEHEKLQKQLYNSQKQCALLEEEQKKGCDACRSFAANEETFKEEIGMLTGENRDYRDDIEMMKILIYRLNEQIERYQEMLRKKHVTASDGTLHMTHNTALNTSFKQRGIHWGTMDSNVLAPLLNAYQETINEKTELIQQFEIELNEITGRVKDIVKENDVLHEEMDALKHTNDSWMAEKTRLKAHLDICR